MCPAHNFIYLFRYLKKFHHLSQVLPRQKNRPSVSPLSHSGFEPSLCLFNTFSNWQLALCTASNSSAYVQEIDC